MIDVIIPCLNEPTIDIVVHDMLNVDGINHIIVVDDGSDSPVFIPYISDKKVSILRNEKPTGKTDAVKRGLELVSTEHVILQDADLEYPVSNLQNLLCYIDKYDMVIARRMLPVNQVTLSGVIANRIITTLLKAPDVFSGQRIVNTEFLKDVVTLSDGFSLETVIFLEARRRNLRTLWVDSFYYPRTYKEGKKIMPYHMIPILWKVFKYAFNRQNCRRYKIQKCNQTNQSNI
jgi:glycosyltransferase involved in cell wall biosynthesis